MCDLCRERARHQVHNVLVEWAVVTATRVELAMQVGLQRNRVVRFVRLRAGEGLLIGLLAGTLCRLSEAVAFVSSIGSLARGFLAATAAATLGVASLCPRPSRTARVLLGGRGERVV